MAHSVPHSGHLGIRRTMAQLTRRFYWPGIKADATKYVAQCEVCQRAKSHNLPPGGLLHPLPVPEQRWSSISMDFITGLPPTAAGFEAILTVVDRLTKMIHLLPTHTTATAQQLAQLFTDGIVRLHSFPTSIVSDRDSLFTSKFWIAFCAATNTNRHLSTSYHPQTDGQTERANHTIEQILRGFVADH